MAASSPTMMAVGALCAMMAVGALMHTTAPATTHLMTSTDVTARPVVSRSAPLSYAPRTHTVAGRQVIPEPTANEVQFQEATQYVAVQAPQGQAPAWLALPLAALFSGATMLAISFFRKATQQRATTPLSAMSMDAPFMAMAATSGESDDAPKTTRRGSSFQPYASAMSEVDSIDASQLKEYLDNGYKMVDVRPNYERERIAPAGVLHVQFVKENETGPLDLMSLGRKWAATSYAGYSRDFVRNTNMGAELEAVAAKDDKLILVCADGLRSLCAAKMLQDDHQFTNLVWLKEGLQTCRGESYDLLKSEGTSVEVGYKKACLDAGGLFGANLLEAISGQDWWSSVGGGKNNLK